MIKNILFVVFTLSLLTACANTIRGVGEDLRQSGEAIKEVTHPAPRYIPPQSRGGY